MSTLSRPSLGGERRSVLQSEADRVSELRVLLVSGGQVELVEARVCHRVDDLIVERQHELRRQVGRSADELDQVGQALIRCDHKTQSVIKVKFV